MSTLTLQSQICFDSSAINELAYTVINLPYTDKPTTYTNTEGTAHYTRACAYTGKMLKSQTHVLTKKSIFAILRPSKTVHFLFICI